MAFLTVKIKNMEKLGHCVLFILFILCMHVGLAYCTVRSPFSICASLVLQNYLYFPFHLESLIFAYFYQCKRVNTDPGKN